MPLLPQTMFNPKAGGSSYYDPARRLQELYQQFQQNPGQMPGGSGSTGLMSWDRQGYGRMLDDQREFAALQAYGQRKPLNTEYGGDMGSTRTVSEATGAMNPYAFNRPANMGGAEIRDEFSQGALGALKNNKPGIAGDYLRKFKVMR